MQSGLGGLGKALVEAGDEYDRLQDRRRNQAIQDEELAYMRDKRQHEALAARSARSAKALDFLRILDTHRGYVSGLEPQALIDDANLLDSDGDGIPDHLDPEPFVPNAPALDAGAPDLSLAAAPAPLVGIPGQAAPTAPGGLPAPAQVPPGQGAGPAIPGGGLAASPKVAGSKASPMTGSGAQALLSQRENVLRARGELNTMLEVAKSRIKAEFGDVVPPKGTPDYDRYESLLAALHDQLAPQFEKATDSLLKSLTDHETGRAGLAGKKAWGMLLKDGNGTRAAAYLKKNGYEANLDMLEESTLGEDANGQPVLIVGSTGMAIPLPAAIGMVSGTVTEKDALAMWQKVNLDAEKNRTAYAVAKMRGAVQANIANLRAQNNPTIRMMDMIQPILLKQQNGVPLTAADQAVLKTVGYLAPKSSNFAADFKLGTGAYSAEQAEKGRKRMDSAMRTLVNAYATMDPRAIDAATAGVQDAVAGLHPDIVSTSMLDWMSGGAGAVQQAPVQQARPATPNAGGLARPPAPKAPVKGGPKD